MCFNIIFSISKQHFFPVDKYKVLKILFRFHQACNFSHQLLHQIPLQRFANFLLVLLFRKMINFNLLLEAFMIPVTDFTTPEFSVLVATIFPLSLLSLPTHGFECLNVVFLLSYDVIFPFIVVKDIFSTVALHVHNGLHTHNVIKYGLIKIFSTK